MDVLIRNERAADCEAISEVTRLAFATMEYSRQTEHLIVEALRTANALSVSLVAEVDGRVVGHIAFSPVTVTDSSKGWYGLGPVSVHPDLQRRGIGKSLIQEGIERGEFEADINPESVAAALVGTWDALFLQAWFEDDFDPVTIARDFLSILINGLSGRS